MMEMKTMTEHTDATIHVGVSSSVAPPDIAYYGWFAPCVAFTVLLVLVLLICYSYMECTEIFRAL
jgi:hypothetical protein